MHERCITKMRKCQCMKFLCIISGCPAGARKWHISDFAMLLHSKTGYLPPEDTLIVYFAVCPWMGSFVTGEADGSFTSYHVLRPYISTGVLSSKL